MKGMIQMAKRKNEEYNIPNNNNRRLTNGEIDALIRFRNGWDVKQYVITSIIGVLFGIVFFILLPHHKWFAFAIGLFIALIMMCIMSLRTVKSHTNYKLALYTGSYEFVTVDKYRREKEDAFYITVRKKEQRVVVYGDDKGSKKSGLLINVKGVPEYISKSFLTQLTRSKKS